MLFRGTSSLNYPKVTELFPSQLIPHACPALLKKALVFVLILGLFVLVFFVLVFVLVVFF